ncbi:MAG: hypothetical protein RLY70_2406 [Planctomycetota bacterium]
MSIRVIRGRYLFEWICCCGPAVAYGSAVNEGAANEGAANEGAANEGAANEGAANEGAVNESAVNEGGGIGQPGLSAGAGSMPCFQRRPASCGSKSGWPPSRASSL